MNKKFFIAAAFLPFVLGINSTYAAEVSAEPLLVSPPKIDSNGLAKREASTEGGASVSGATGIETGMAPPDNVVLDKNGAGLVTPLATCTSWWGHGSHSWKYRYAFLYVKNELSAQTDTYYGTSTDPDACGRPPLVADVLSINAITAGGWPGVIVKQTGYNTSIITKSNSATAFGGGLSPICGAAGTHTATKSGITWSTYTKSGCA